MNLEILSPPSLNTSVKNQMFVARNVTALALLVLLSIDFLDGYQTTHRKIFVQPTVGSAFRRNYASVSQMRGNIIPSPFTHHMSASEATRPTKTPDFLALLNYITATSVQVGLIAGFLHLFQIKVIDKVKDLVIVIPASIKAALPAKIVAELPSKIVKYLPSVMVGLFVLFMSLKSRVFSPLDNSRPQASKDDPQFKGRNLPSWMPPPVVFPVVWSTIALLRTASTVLIFRSAGTLLCPPIFALMAHLSIGDTWNTISNVEKRMGTAVLGVAFVWASALYATYLYYKQMPLAGKILFPSCIWLTVASLLVYSIWRMNAIYLNERRSLFPSKEEGPRSTWRVPFLPYKK